MDLTLHAQHVIHSDGKENVTMYIKTSKTFYMFFIVKANSSETKLSWANALCNSPRF